MSPLSPVTSTDHIRGEVSAPLTLVQYGDFECPYSGMAYGVIKQLQSRLGERLCYVFRPFPLYDIHPHALRAALAGEAASDKFWEMHDLLFENQDALEDENLVEYARTLDIDLKEFQHSFNSDETHKKVKQSLHDGASSGVHGTPTFFVNGVFHDNREGLWTTSKLLHVLSAALGS